MKLETVIEGLPRIKLANLPTPLEEMPRLSKLLGGPKIWIKRDDLTGLAFGGNKVRKLEFEMADAVKQGADVIVAGGVIQSNHALATTVAARRLGMKVVLLLRGEEPQEYTGNLLLDHIFGAEIRFIQAEWHESAEITRNVVEELKGKGYTPYAVPFSSPLGSVGYVNAVLELQEQAKRMNLKVDCLVHAAGSGGTQAGLIVGNKALETGIDVIGIATESDDDWLLNTTTQIADECARLLHLDLTVTRDDVKILYDYVGEGYRILGEKLKETIKLVARTEGVLLDPVYTVKAVAGLIDMVKQGRFEKHENIVFLHTGGTPAIFAYKDELKSLG
ncbi:D-cysteine desulfhydrase family protein, partial [Candidatus Bathyarchaeota archaeon]|nr:D-cysteine desulfhydrase family protein [Candidatus Bathyarchaeota archaeon]